MFDSLFGAEMPLAVRFFLAFLIVLGLIGITAWVVRRFGTGRLGGGTARGRQPRLAVVDYASVDGRRRLILVRRDNTEHLLMIGGPTDIVVEPNIVRAVAAPRDLPGTRAPAGLDALPRAIPLPENGNGSWPLQPEPAGGPRPLPRAEPLPEGLPRMLAPEISPRPPRDTLAALADELSPRPAAAPRPRQTEAKPPVEEAVVEPHSEPVAELRAEPRIEPRQELRPEPRKDAGQEARAETPPEMRHEPRQEARPEPRKPAPPAAPAPQPSPAPIELAMTPDQSLADMAQRLEAALRKPHPEPRPAPATRVTPPAEAAAPRMPRPAEIKPPRSEPKPKDAKASLYDNLEQEMASLLGRPTKT